MKEFDDIFKRKLEHHTVDVPDNAWDKIAQQLPRKKFHLSPVVWTSALAFLLVLTVSFGIYLSVDSNTNKNISDSQDRIVSIDNFNSKSDNNNFSALDEEQNPTISMHDKENENFETINTQGKSNQITAKKSSIVQDFVASHNGPFNDNEDLEENSINITNIQLNTTDNLNISNEENNDVQKEDLVSNDIEWNLVGKTELSNVEVFPTLDSDELNVESLLKQEVTYEKSLVHFSGDKEPCSFLWSGYQKSVDIYYSNDYVDMKLEGPSSLSDHVEMREATEKSVYSYSVGARLGYNLSYRWNLHTGINYSQMTQRFQYTDPEANEPRVEIIKKYIFSNGQLVDSTFTEETVYLPGSKHHKVYNKYRTWDIPVLARYTLAANNKMSLSAMGGIFFNVSFQQTGIILDTDNTTPISLNRQSSEETRIFKAGLGVSAFASLSLAYYLTPSLDLLIEPNARIAPASMTTSKYPLTQRFNTYGLSVGLRHRF